MLLPWGLIAQKQISRRKGTIITIVTAITIISLISITITFSVTSTITIAIPITVLPHCDFQLLRQLRWLRAFF